jgi:hypothetical protein
MVVEGVRYSVPLRFLAATQDLSWRATDVVPDITPLLFATLDPEERSNPTLMRYSELHSSEESVNLGGDYHHQSVITCRTGSMTEFRRV